VQTKCWKEPRRKERPDDANQDVTKQAEARPLNQLACQPSGYRAYDEATVDRIKLARSLQMLGLTLDEIIDALAAHDRGDATCQSERWRLESVLDRIDANIADLRRMRRGVVDVLAECDAGRCRMLGDPVAGS